MPGQAAPSRHVAVIALDHLQRRAGRAEHAEIGHAPIVAIENEKIGSVVAAEVADDQLVMLRQAAPPRYVAIVASRHSQIGRACAEHADIAHAPVGAIEDIEVVSPVAAKIADK